MDEKKKENKVTEEKKVEKDTKKEEKPKTEKKVATQKEETKKFEAKNNNAKQPKKDKKTNWFITLITAIIVIVIAAILTFMIVTSSDPKKSVDGLLTNLKAGDFEKAQEFLSGEEIVSDTDFSEETQKLLFDKLAWKVTKITEEGNQATIELEVTNKDFKVLISNYMQKALKAAFGGASITEQEMENYFTEELKNEEGETTTVTKTIQAVKEEKKWKIVSNDELTDAILPGLQEAINSLS